MQKINIFWFRRDLRLYDNHALSLALKEDLPILAIFIFDQEILNLLKNKRDARVSFIYKTLQEISKKIAQKKGTLLLLYGKVLDVWQSLLQQHNIHKVFANEDYEPYAIERDSKVRNLLKEKNISFVLCKDQVIFAKLEIQKENVSPYVKYSPYKKKWRASITKEHCSIYSCEDSGKWISINSPNILSLEDLGFEETYLEIPDFKIAMDKIKNYHLYRDIPSAQATTRLGLHLRFGTISIRELVQFAIKENEIFLSELIWREFFMQILYHFPYVAKHPFRKEYNSIKWVNNPEQFEIWCKGKTGFPLVDAGMRQLNKTGYMHNRVRMIVASFLVKNLLIDWRWGEAYFAEKLLDYELSSNNGNWQWAASTGCDSVPYFRIFNPILQQKRFDPQENYIKTWIEEYQTSDYPKPMIENKNVKQKAIEAYSIPKAASFPGHSKNF